MTKVTCPSCDGLRYDAWVGNPIRDCTVCHGRGTVDAPAQKITFEEVMNLFGGEIPIEAFAILTNASPDVTVGEVRAEITELALSWQTRTTKRERIAHAMWRQQAERAAPSIARWRTPEAFRDADPQLRNEWLGYADAALAVITEEPPCPPTSTT